MEKSNFFTIKKSLLMTIICGVFLVAVCGIIVLLFFKHQAESQWKRNTNVSLPGGSEYIFEEIAPDDIASAFFSVTDCLYSFSDFPIQMEDRYISRFVGLINNAFGKHQAEEYYMTYDNGLSQPDSDKYKFYVVMKDGRSLYIQLFSLMLAFSQGPQVECYVLSQEDLNKFYDFYDDVINGQAKYPFADISEDDIAAVSANLSNSGLEPTWPLTRKEISQLLPTLKRIATYRQVFYMEYWATTVNPKTYFVITMTDGTSISISEYNPVFRFGDYICVADYQTMETYRSFFGQLSKKYGYTVYGYPDYF